MKNLNLLPVAEEIREQIAQTARNYAQHLSLETSILDVGADFVTVSIKQIDKRTDRVFDKQELIQKAREVFSHLPEGLYKLHIRPLEFAGVGLEAVSADWVKNQLKKHNLHQTDLCDAFGVDKPAMSKLMNNSAGFTRWHKAAFYYYFKALSVA